LTISWDKLDVLCCVCYYGVLLALLAGLPLSACSIRCAVLAEGS
jgi:hypothetical protein